MSRIARPGRVHGEIDGVSQTADQVGRQLLIDAVLDRVLDQVLLDYTGEGLRPARDNHLTESHRQKSIPIDQSNPDRESGREVGRELGQDLGEVLSTYHRRVSGKTLGEEIPFGTKTQADQTLTVGKENENKS